MKAKYDFSKAVRGKFYHPNATFTFPIYLDPDIEKLLGQFGFKRIQWSVYAANHEDLAKLFGAIDGLRKLEWMGPSVVDLRAFRMEQGSDFTGVVKG